MKNNSFLERTNLLRERLNNIIRQVDMNSPIDMQYYQVLEAYQKTNNLLSTFIFYYPPNYVAISLIVPNQDKKELYCLYKQQIEKMVDSFSVVDCYFNQFTLSGKDRYIDAINQELLATPLTTRHEFSSMAIVLYQNKVLLLINQEGKHVLPKGHIEKAESTLDAAIRECFEETGVKITKQDFIATLPSYSYSFSGANLKHMTNSEFYSIFSVNRIIKTIDVNVFNINEYQVPNVTEKYFEGAIWLEIDAIDVAFSEDLKRIKSAFLLRNNDGNT